MINAAGHYQSLFLIIIQNQKLMTSWFCEEWPTDILILTSDSGFISNKIEVEFLKNYIENSDADPHANWKLMLMNNDENHCIHEFVTLVNDNHIRFYSLIFYLTHCMQSLNVGVFQTYKPWHDVAIQQKILTSFVKYTVLQFLRDFSKIRNSAFKSSTIRNVFKNSEMWFINADVCIKKFKKYTSNNFKHAKLFHKHNSRLSSSPFHKIHSQTPADVKHALADEWGPKIQQNMQWSDSIREV